MAGRGSGIGIYSEFLTTSSMQEKDNEGSWYKLRVPASNAREKGGRAPGCRARVHGCSVSEA